MAQGHTYSVDQIKDMLVQRIRDVVHIYAPRVSGSYEDKGRYFTLNPMRADRSVGSFCVHLSGPKAGRWNDYATREAGDVIDLIAGSLHLSTADAFKEARAFLGLQNDTPEDRRKREAQLAEAKIRREAAEADAADKAERAKKRAEALFLSAQERLAGTPVQHYLANRAIDLATLGRQPRSLRYHPEVAFHHEETDPETGEVHTIRLKLPAMLAAVCNGRGQIIDCHRTYLGLGPDGRWGKARIASPVSGKLLKVKKLTWGCNFMEGSIRLSSGLGPKGGKGARLADCPPGTRVYVAEGIETGLSALILKPGIRVLAAVSLSNFGSVDLPANVAEVVLINDNDPSEAAQAAFQAGVAMHQKAGRIVRIWQSDVPGDDLNDALQRAVRDAEKQGAA